MASVGMTASIVLGGLPWYLVYIVEHVPVQFSLWFNSDWHWPGRFPDSQENDRKPRLRDDSVAYFAKDDLFYIFNCNTVLPWFELTARVAAFCSAIFVVIAYICQYVELRTASPRASGIWLGLQGVLALIRVAGWVYAPFLTRLSMNDHVEVTWSRDSHWVKPGDFELRDSVSEIEILLCWASAPPIPKWLWEKRRDFESLDLPSWLVGRLDRVKLSEVLSLDTRRQFDRYSPEAFKSVQDAEANFWDMPEHIFKRWLQLKCRKAGHKVTYNSTKDDTRLLDLQIR